MPYEAIEHRGIEIRYGYNIHTDGYRANFTLPSQQRRKPAFQRVVPTNLPEAVEPGKNHIDADTAEEAVSLARKRIDAYLGE